MISLLAMMLAAPAAAPDTLQVDAAKVTTPYSFHRPYASDSTDMQGKTYDANKIYDENASLVKRTALFTQVLRRGDAIPADTADARQSLVGLRFAINADRFAKVHLNIKDNDNYRLYVDGKATSDKNLTLTPGRSIITLLSMTKPGDKQKFNVFLTGKDLQGITLGEDQPRAYDMALMLQGKHCRSLSLSPSGKYLVTTYYDTQADGSNLWSTEITETANGRVLYSTNGSLSVRWWPHRDILYYTGQNNLGTTLETLDPATLKREVIATSLPSTSFTLAPTGDYMVFYRSTGGRTEPLQGLKRLEDPDDRMPGWRNRSQLYRFDFATGQVTQLTFGSASAYLADISPDGKRLLISHGTMKPSRKPFNRTTVIEMDAFTGKADTLLADTTFLGGMTYSPDGRTIAITASPGAFGGIGKEMPANMEPSHFDYRIYLYSLDTRKVTPALPHFAPSVDQVKWAYGDNQIYLLTTEGCDRTIYRLNPKTLERTRFQLPLSYISSFSIAEGMRKPYIVFTGQTGERAREMFLATLDKEKPAARRIGDMDFDRDYANVAIGKCQDWAFRTSHGDTIHGFYFLPPNFDATKKYPLIVYYYSGCTPTSKTLEFQYPLQVLAAQGYVIYVCEPSGTIGYGQEFAARHVCAWGRRTADDIIEGTKQFVAEHPYVNAQRIGCMGASYGGFMTQYLQTRTDIFAAAISHAGISNLASYWGGGYWGYTYNETAASGSYPWNDKQLYVEQSPLFNADKIHTPLLLLHGTVDTNVPTNESQQLFTALRILGRKVSYVQVDGENHVITDYKKRLAWQNVIFAWFAHWLKDQPLWWNTLYPNDHFGQD